MGIVAPPDLQDFMIVIRPQKNLYAKLEGKIAPEDESMMQEFFIWRNPLDFEDYYQLYAKGYMYVGVMHNVADYLKHSGYNVVVDMGELSPPDFEAEFLREFRPLQSRLYDAAIAKRFGLLAACPGVGKTTILTAVLSALGKKAVVLTQAEEPFEGAYETIRDYSTCNVGRVGGGYHEPSDVTVCMVQTWNRRLTADEVDPELIKVLREAKVWITDEAHNCLTNSYFNMYEYAENVEYFLGTTATPFTSNDRETLLYARVGPILSEIKYGEAIDNKILVPFTCYIEDAAPQVFSKDKTKLASYAKKRLWSKVKKEYITNNQKRNKQYVDFAKESNSLGLSCAIIVSQVNHGKNMKKLYPDAVEVYGPTPKKRRKEIWAQLKTKEIKCVITTLMDEATDIPSLDCVALAAGGKSKVKLIQRLRNLRTFAGETVDGWFEKERGYVFITRDNADYVKTHSDKNIGYLRELKREHHLNEIIKF